MVSRQSRYDMIGKLPVNVKSILKVCRKVFLSWKFKEMVGDAII
jgi:hypothetical protein